MYKDWIGIPSFKSSLDCKSDELCLEGGIWPLLPIASPIIFSIFHALGSACRTNPYLVSLTTQVYPKASTKPDRYFFS